MMKEGASVKKKVVAVALAAVGLRLALMTGMGSALVDWIQQQAKDGRLVSATLNVELGSAGGKDEQALASETEAPSPEPAETVQPTGEPEDTENVTDIPPEPEESQNIIATTLDGSAIMNHTSFEADPAELMAEGMSLSLPSEGPQILIIHTHTTEAYTPDGTDQYEASGEARSLTGTAKLLDSVYLVCQNGDFTSEQDGNTYRYRVALDSRSMDEILDVLAPDAAKLDIDFTDSTAGVTICDDVVTELTISCGGSVKVLLTQASASVTAEVHFVDEPMPEIPDAALKALQ